ncbi:MAG: hypothetical protein IT267_09270 [Saprospiraceae bacterium]|nr:hypothetical protein [Saprospiraceae bacterium]
MKNRKISPSELVLLFFVLVGLSSCNRGYGCPYDFSIMDNLTILFKNALSFFSLLF